MMSDKPLVNQMIRRAEADQLPDGHELRTLAADLDRIGDEYAGGHCSPKKFLGAWARARLAWCRHTGEALI